MFRKNELDANTPRLVAFVDVGYSKSSVIFANAWKNKSEIIVEKTNKNLGCRNFDL